MGRMNHFRPRCATKSGPEDRFLKIDIGTLSAFYGAGGR
ncbi:hypothetical protein CES85_2733 [Ochrobactrum quorumnocens]|uniref:Uncharacterized protein n=1 Tax=Ochrobactrum quorumnocens TaxID=271865 RepID=A0A248UIU9_9HYPH|nr:hypothetical protein CES85_2733 [[Ochrobactrum] quorumnocens]